MARTLPPHHCRPDGSPPLSAAEAWLRANGKYLAEWDDIAPEKPSRLPDQVDVARDLLVSGATEVEIRLELQRQFGTRAKPKAAYDRALTLVIQEQRDRMAVLPELVMAARWRAIQGAMRQGNFGAAASLLRDAGTVAGEGAPERIAEEMAGLTITIEAHQPEAA
jgi:hypothetical protein